jgi:GAF domain-containing protein
MSRAAHEALTDPARLSALRDTGLLDSPPEEPFDRLTRLASKLLDVPVALVSLVEDDRQFFKSSVGLPEPYASERETPLTHSFCQHVTVMSGPLLVKDARTHPLVKDNQAVTDLDVIAYAGVPLEDRDGQTLGSLCAIDTKPRRWSEEDVAVLEDEPVTCSFGVAAFPEHAPDSETLLRSADQALYRAKANGRNRVESAAELDFAVDEPLPR